MYKVEGESDRYVEYDDTDGQHIQGQSSFFKGREKTRSYLQSNGINEQNQPELLYEMEYVFFGGKTEVPGNQADEKYKCDS